MQFQYWDESDGVDLKTGASFPFYPIPPEVISASPLDGRRRSRATSINAAAKIVICLSSIAIAIISTSFTTCSTIPPKRKWYAGSGAFFDMGTNNRRTNGWTSADAAGFGDTSGIGPLRRSL